MGRVYKRKTTHATDQEGLRNAAEKVMVSKMPVRTAARMFKVPRTSLQRYIDLSPDDRASMGYAGCSTKNLVIPPAMEAALANHIKDMDNRYHGLSVAKCSSLAYEFAVLNGIKVPGAWTENGSAGESD